MSAKAQMVVSEKVNVGILNWVSSVREFTFVLTVEFLNKFRKSTCPFD